jgi:hypothetical protein
MLPGTTTMDAKLRHSDARYLRQVRLNVKFDNGELSEVNSSRDVLVVNNLPPWKLKLGIFAT